MLLFLLISEGSLTPFFLFFLFHFILTPYGQSFRLFLFSAESPDSQKEWIRTLLMASSTARRGGGGGEGGGEGGREVVLKCSCEGFTKLVKAEVGVEYEVLREKVSFIFLILFLCFVGLVFSFILISIFQNK